MSFKISKSRLLLNTSYKLEIVREHTIGINVDDFW